MQLWSDSERAMLAAGQRAVPKTTTRYTSDGCARQICTFFAMGGCSRGERCQFSHELTQTAPDGVDATGGFFISGNVANYRPAPATAPARGAVEASLTVSPLPAAPALSGPASTRSLNPQAEAFCALPSASTGAASAPAPPQPPVTVRVNAVAGKTIHVAGTDMVAALARMTKMRELAPAASSGAAQESSSVMQLSSSGSSCSSPQRTSSNVSSTQGAPNPSALFMTDARGAGSGGAPLIPYTTSLAASDCTASTTAVSPTTSASGTAPYQPRYTLSQSSFRGPAASPPPASPSRSIVVGRQPMPPQPQPQHPQQPRVSDATLVPAPRSTFSGQPSPTLVASVAAPVTGVGLRGPGEQPLPPPQHRMDVRVVQSLAASGRAPVPAMTPYTTVRVGERARARVGVYGGVPQPELHGQRARCAPESVSGAALAHVHAGGFGASSLSGAPACSGGHVMQQQQQPQLPPQSRLYVVPQRYVEQRPQPQPAAVSLVQSSALQQTHIQRVPVPQPQPQPQPQAFMLAATNTPGQFALVTVGAEARGNVRGMLTGGSANSVYVLEGNTLRCLPSVTVLPTGA